MLDWILRRCFDEVGAEETQIGFVPHPEDIELTGAGVSRETLEGLLRVDPELWREETAGIRTFYQKMGGHLPRDLAAELDALEARLK